MSKTYSTLHGIAIQCVEFCPDYANLMSGGCAGGWVGMIAAAAAGEGRSEDALPLTKTAIWLRHRAPVHKTQVPMLAPES